MSTKPHSSPDTSPKNKPSTHANSGDIRLSVVIACWNAAKTLPVQLEALANQQWDKAWEVVFVDNGSTDDSMAIAEQYRSRIPEMQIIAATEKQNQQYALNVGVRAARSDAIALCDADDEVAPGWVAAMGEALARYDFIAGPWETSKLNDPWIAAGHGNAQKNGLMQQPGYFSYAGSGNMGIRRSAWEKVGGFNEDLPDSSGLELARRLAGKWHSPGTSCNSSRRPCYTSAFGRASAAPSGSHTTGECGRLTSSDTITCRVPTFLSGSDSFRRPKSRSARDCEYGRSRNFYAG